MIIYFFIHLLNTLFTFHPGRENRLPILPDCLHKTTAYTTYTTHFPYPYIPLTQYRLSNFLYFIH